MPMLASSNHRPDSLSCVGLTPPPVLFPNLLSRRAHLHTKRRQLRRTWDRTAHVRENQRCPRNQHRPTRWSHTRWHSRRLHPPWVSRNLRNEVVGLAYSI